MLALLTEYIENRHWKGNISENWKQRDAKRIGGMCVCVYVVVAVLSLLFHSLCQ